MEEPEDREGRLIERDDRRDHRVVAEWDEEGKLVLELSPGQAMTLGRALMAMSIDVGSGASPVKVTIGVVREGEGEVQE